jgi:hypothetical protein
VVEFTESAFRHGYDEEDFFELLEAQPMKIRSTRGLNLYELLGRHGAGDYIHVAYRREGDREVVFHMRGMSAAERRRYRDR